MDKLKMQSINKIDENVERIEAMFPNCVTEARVNDKLTKVVDFDMLKQELSSFVVEGNEERYQFTWPDKKKIMLKANEPIFQTLRFYKEESKEPEKTQNLYIEGKNLDVLKLLQETYLGKIKMIYIDPPYNTGSDFIYKDNFAQSTDEYISNSGQLDEEGNHLVKNFDSNGRFHTDWLNMMYPILKLAKDLLSDDGVIFISIDDNEVENLKKICNEIYGENNYIGEIIRKTKSMTGDSGSGFNLQHETLLVFSKNKDNVSLIGEEKDFSNYNNPDNDPRGIWCSGDPSAKSGGLSTSFEIENPHTGIKDYPPTGRYWAFSQATLKKYISSGRIVFKQEHGRNERGFIFKRYKADAKNLYNPINSLFAIENEFMNQRATTELRGIFSDSVFNYPKPISFLYQLAKSSTSGSDIILDFFSGSATTAHAVMQLNAEDGGNRKFIMVQIPEETDEKSEAYKAGYKNICEIGKERIRRAGAKILSENPEAKIDTGFRVLKCDSTNMKDVYYNPEEFEVSLLDKFIDNIKEDRTPEDLLFQVMLDLGVLLSSKIEESIIGGKKVFNVADGFLIACFDDEVKEETIKAIAEQKPYYFVMRDSSMADDNVATNFEQIFATYSPDTVRKVL